MSELTLRFDLNGATTTVIVEGSVEAHHCRALSDGLEMAGMLRPRGPIVVDVGGVDRLAAAALAVLRRAADDARRTGRALTVRHLRPDAVHDTCSVRLLHGLWADPPDATAPAPRETRQRQRRHAGRRRGGRQPGGAVRQA
ncbi:MAG TPA: STAS domain-containing protein [Pilimelia sp.]|nr:STAS domain-containing protein [Pilimelia sp.]